MSTTDQPRTRRRHAAATSAVVCAVLTLTACGSQGDSDPTKRSGATPSASSSPSASGSPSTAANVPAGYSNRSFCDNASDYALVVNTTNGRGPQDPPNSPAGVKFYIDRVYFSTGALVQQVPGNRSQQARRVLDFWSGVRSLYSANKYRYTDAMGRKFDELGRTHQADNVDFLKYLDQRCGRGIGDPNFAQRPKSLAN